MYKIYFIVYLIRSFSTDASLCNILNTGNGYYLFITVYIFSDYNLLHEGTFSSIFHKIYLPHAQVLPLNRLAGMGGRLTLISADAVLFCC